MQEWGIQYQKNTQQICSNTRSIRTSMASKSFCTMSSANLLNSALYCRVCRFCKESRRKFKNLSTVKTTMATAKLATVSHIFYATIHSSISLFHGSMVSFVHLVHLDTLCAPLEAYVKISPLQTMLSVVHRVRRGTLCAPLEACVKISPLQTMSQRSSCNYWRI